MFSDRFCMYFIPLSCQLYEAPHYVVLSVLLIIQTKFTHSLVQSLSWKVNMQPMKKCHACYRNHRLSIMYTRLDPLVSQLSPLDIVTPNFLWSVLLLYLHSCLCLPNSLFLSGFPTKTLYVFSDSPYSYYMSISFHPRYWMSFFFTQVIISAVTWQHIYFLK